TTGVAVGSHTLTVNAIDWSQIAGGVQQRSAPVTVDVGPAYPTISLSAPAAWSFVRGQTQLTASVTSVGTTSVQFSVDGSPVGTASASPWSVAWNSATVADGTRTITATVTDGRGKQATASAPVTVDNTAPTVAVVAPPAGSFAAGTLAVSA